jgi:FtsZ-binding cell division protein ZapB
MGEAMPMQHLQSLSLLEERIQAAVELITYLKNEKKKLEADNARSLEAQRGLERRLEALAGEKQQQDTEFTALRAKRDEWDRYERDRDEIRARIDNMLAKFEELEV